MHLLNNFSQYYKVPLYIVHGGLQRLVPNNRVAPFFWGGGGGSKSTKIIDDFPLFYKYRLPVTKVIELDPKTCFILLFSDFVVLIRCTVNKLFVT